jgi:SAM-dependent methyltransferase
MKSAVAEAWAVSMVAGPSAEAVLEDEHDARVADALKEGIAISDGVFDLLYPRAVRTVSSIFWTPVSVALRAAELLVVDCATRVLDVGSGAGKFCVVGALATGASFTGIEHRAHLVSTARDAARRLGARANFIHGRLASDSLEDIDAIYFFNPFAENAFPPEDHLDQTVELSLDRALFDVELAERLLAGARVGTRVVTYHGFGGDMPPSYTLERSEPHRTDKLELWIKTSAGEIDRA